MMRSLEETRIRWQETVKHSSGFADLQRAVKFNGPESPCIAGCRSVCWKAFLLFHTAPASDWAHILLEARNTYSSLRDHYLMYIKHPEKLTELSLDPLADVPESPWNAFREDELIRAEILQDVRRLPDEPFYHQESTQTLILDVLFIYCKLNPDVGGYRQGMHELLAPMVYVVHLDAIDRAEIPPDHLADPVMVQMLDSYFVEHDAFALFSRLMDKAKGFYEISESPAPVLGFASAAGPTEQSAIVEKSRRIHEVTLMTVDPELARHLKAIEVLPQIFLIRWIRLLFSREFPFDQQLVFWDTIFAFDPSLELIDLICVAMLIRIRWTLLEADYSSALQTLLKYPAPQPPHGPHTFVDDAVYLKDHMDRSGAATLVLKYTGKLPPTPPTSSSTPSTTTARSPRPTTPNLSGGSGNSLRPRSSARSPISSPARFIQQQASMEALFQGAAKNFLERGEKLGLNQAVRDAMGEIRRNVQHGIQEARRAASGRGDVFATASSSSPDARGGHHRQETHLSASAMSRRNRQLAAMLEETISTLRALAQDEGEEASRTTKEKHKHAIEMAAARVQFVQVYLEDSTLDLPDGDPLQHHQRQHQRQKSTPTAFPTDKGHKRDAVVAEDTNPAAAANTAAVLDAVRELSPGGSYRAAQGVDLGNADKGGSNSTTTTTTTNGAHAASSSIPDAIVEEGEGEEEADTGVAGADRMDMDLDMGMDDGPNATFSSTTTISTTTTAATPTATPAATLAPPVTAAVSASAPAPIRPRAPIPTRSTIAQSSFSWMLEPEASPSSSTSTPPPFRSSRGAPGGGEGGPFSSSSSSASRSAPPSHKKRPSASRERNAFLFGEVISPEAVGDGAGGAGGSGGRRSKPLTSDEIFGLEPLRKALPGGGSS